MKLNELEAILFTSEEISARVRELGDTISRTYAGRKPVIVAVLQGAVVFYADLIRSMPIDMVCDAAVVRSYRGERAAEPELLFPPARSWNGQDVLFVDAIVDTGKTAELLLDIARRANVRSARLCTLLDKPARRTAPLVPDFTGFTVGDDFVVGYGLDFHGEGRNFACIGVAPSGAPAPTERNELK